MRTLWIYTINGSTLRVEADTVVYGAQYITFSSSIEGQRDKLVATFVAKNVISVLEDLSGK